MTEDHRATTPEQLVDNMAPDADDDYEVVKTRILPSVRPTSYLKLMNINLLDGDADQPLCDTLVEPHSIAYQAICDDISVCFVIDSPDSAQLITHQLLAEWDMSFDEVMPVALDNLRKLKPDAGFEQVQPGIYLGHWHDHYDGARLLLPELFAIPNLKGRPVAWLTGKRDLFVTGSMDDDAIERMVALALTLLDDDEAYHAAPIVLSDGVWRKFSVAKNSPLYGRLSFHKLFVTHCKYADQKPTLERWLERRGQALSVNIQNMNQSEDNLHFTVAVWDEENALLPVSDLIVFMRGDQNLDGCSWETAINHFGDYMQLMDFDPARYLIRGLPPLEKLAATEKITFILEEEK